MRRLSYIVIIILIILNGLLSYNLFLNNKKLNYINLALNRKNKEISTFQSNFKWEKVNNNLILDEDLGFFDVSGNKILAKNFLKKNMIVLRFSESNCEDCINSEIDVLLKNKELKENIILIISLQKKRDLFVYHRKYKEKGLKNIKMYLLADNGLNIPAEKLNMPYYFCVNSSLTMTNFFIPQKDKPKLSENYLETTSKNYLRK